jgi:hypothetical protein
MRPGLVALPPPLRRLPDPLRHHAPAGGGRKALQDIHEAGIAADQDARLVNQKGKNQKGELCARLAFLVFFAFAFFAFLAIASSFELMD